MKCSLIIPAYNAEKTIKRCLKSAMEQTLPREIFEIIVVDDGSTDRTRRIVKEFPVKIVSQKNQGPAVARNRGAREASGDILLFTDSDCELDSNFVKNMIAPFDIDSEIAGVQGSYKTKQKEFMAMFSQVEIETRYKIMARNKYIDFIGTYAAAYKKDIFENYGAFDTGFPLASGEDTEFSYKLHKANCKMVFQPEAFVFHQHPNKLIHYLKTKFYRGYWRIRLYKKHPEKTIKDSYTPQSLKIQGVCTLLLLIFSLLSIFNLFWLIFLVPYFLLFSYYSFPFIKIFRKRKYPYYYLTPFVLMLRAIVIPAGMLFGIKNEINNLLKKPSS